MELYFEDIIGTKNQRLALTSDAAGNIIGGIGPQTLKYGNGQAGGYSSVITSLDLDLQKKCESLLEDSSACIVADCMTGEILAMASSPGFVPDRIEDYLNQESDCLINKALQTTYPPGSVFKLVTAAAALENEICLPEREFVCMGEATVNGVRVRCSTAPEGGHGRLDMYRAMACSCNCYFVQLGELTGSEKILEMARRLGLGRKVFDGFPEESGGFIPSAAETSAEDISNISIGQGRILITPLQAARMTGIIACGGICREMTLLRKDERTSEVFSFLESSVQKEHRVITERTAAALRDMMGLVMREGTGSAAEFEQAVSVYGKSGTAEASSKGRSVKDCWFTGFYTDDQQQISVTVFIEDGISGSHDALPVFTEIVNYYSSR